MIEIIPMNPEAHGSYFGLLPNLGLTVWLYECTHICFGLTGDACCICKHRSSLCPLCKKV